MYVGRVARVRGADELIELGRRLRGEVEVEVVGDAEADVADRLARAHQRGEITWRGFLPNDQALVRVQGATAGLSLLHDLPNFRGSMPTKVLEYLACGVPVVTTPLPLAARVVRDADAGEVVGFGDVGATERAIRRLNQDDRRREEAAQRGRELVRSRYSWETEAPRFVSHVRRWARPRISLPPLDDDPTVSVVIPAREAARTLERAVASALANGADEVVLAVAPSHDGTEVTARRISAADRRVHVVMNPCGRTPSALNAAIRTARGQIIARLDAHAEFPAGYLARALQLLRDTGASNVGGRQRPVTGSGFAAAVARAMTSPFGAGGAAYRTGAAPRAVDTVYLGVFRREALEAVGGFDERMTRNQDYELNVRLREAGGVVWFAPDLLVAYRPRDSVRGLARQYFEYGRWRRVTLKLHPRSLRSRQLAPPFVVLGLGVSTMASLAMASPWMAFGCWTAYLTGIVGAGVHASARLLQAPSTALALAVMHLSWGVGFLVGPPRHALAPSD